MGTRFILRPTKLIDMTPDTESKGTLAVLTATFLSGLNVYLLRIGTTFIPQTSFVAVALTIAGFMLLTASIILGKGSAILRGGNHIAKFLWIGVIGTSVPVVMIAYGVSLSTVSNSFLLQTEFIYSILLSYVLLRERITGEQILLTVLSFLGIVLILTGGVVTTINIGDVLFLVAPLFYQLAHVVAKGVLRKVDPLVVVMYRLLIAGLALVLVSIALGQNPLPEISGNSQGMLVAFYASLSFSLGNSLWYFGVKHINLSKATSIMIAYPLVSAILAVIMIGETLSPVKIIGASLVFASTYMLSRVRSISREEVTL